MSVLYTVAILAQDWSACTAKHQSEKCFVCLDDLEHGPHCADQAFDCGHCAVCGRCRPKWIFRMLDVESSVKPECPICRKPINSFEELHIPNGFRIEDKKVTNADGSVTIVFVSWILKPGYMQRSETKITYPAGLPSSEIERERKEEMQRLSDKLFKKFFGM